jgi:alpha-beta hydrolase superfamily lysophospholipase
MIEELFEITGADGLVRRGVVSRPDKEKNRSVGIVLLPAGLKYHVGPHRFYVSVARHFADLGYVVLRFDPLGMGESDGVLHRGLTRELWRRIESGGNVDDALLATKAMRDRFALKRIIAGGICGAAITAQLSAAKRPQLIDGVISINTAVNISSVQNIAANAMSSARADHNLRSYLKKLFSIDSWIRLIRLESDFFAIRRTLVAKARAFSPVNGQSVKNDETGMNPQFMKSFYHLEKNGIKHLLLFSGNDNRWFEFKDMVLERHYAANQSGSQIEIKVIPDANHELHFSAWQDEACEILREWLDRNFGPLIV